MLREKGPNTALPWREGGERRPQPFGSTVGCKLELAPQMEPEAPVVWVPVQPLGSMPAPIFSKGPVLGEGLCAWRALTVVGAGPAKKPESQLQRLSAPRPAA